MSLLERLEQKAKTCYQLREMWMKGDKGKWVRLEDVAELIRQATTQAKTSTQIALVMTVEGQTLVSPHQKWIPRNALVDEQTEMKCPRCHKPLPTHTNDSRYTLCDGVPDICPYCQQDLWQTEEKQP